MILAFVALPDSLWAGVRLDFNRSNQTYDWLTTIDYNIGRDGFRFASSLNGQSNLIKGTSNRWQENALARFTSEKAVLPHLGIITSAKYDISGLDKRRVRSSDLTAGISYSPTESIELRPLVRIERIKRSDLIKLQNDQGAGYSLNASMKTFSVAFLNLSSDIAFDDSRLSNIPSNELNGTARASAAVQDNDTIWVFLRGQEAAKKYYNPSGGAAGIIKQIKQERQADFGAALTLPVGMRMRFDGNAHLSRYLYRQSLTDQSAAPQRDNYGRGGGYKIALMGHAADFANAVVGYAWNKASQDFQDSVLDLDSEVGELSFQGTVSLSARDSLAADFLIGVTSYSNPSTSSSNQDRDQQTLVVNSRYSHIFSRFFSLGVSGGVNSFRQIYVSGAQSANNGQNDTYLITPFSRWSPAEWVVINQIFEIQANYITFDFDRKIRGTQNRIFRRASSQTELRLALTSRLTWQQTFMYRFEDYGQLIWNDGWQQAVSWDRKKGGLDTKLTFAPGRIFRFSPLFAWEKTGDYNHSIKLDSLVSEPQEIRYLADEQIKLLFGVELMFDWDSSRKLKLALSHRIREFMSRPREVSDYAMLTMEYLF
jgi:hypothetical protein